MEKENTAIRFNGSVHKVKFLGYPVSPGSNSYGLKLYVMGNEYGPTHLIGAYGDTSAYELYIDDLTELDDSEIYQAYGFPSDRYMQQFTRLHNQDPALAYAWVEKYNSNCWNWKQYPYSVRDKVKHTLPIELNTDGITVPTDMPDLIEGYEYGTGGNIVSTSGYEWMREYSEELANNGL